ncbi:MAG: hypothetical protein H6739_24195 [Alphaproteobacteria bacterium]|nr:hypothetical protein [Alphaproteobacteria bacterium]
MPRTPWLVGALVALALPALAAPSLRYAEDQAPGIVNPLFSTTMAEARVNELLFDSLWVDNTELAAVPALAASGHLSEDMMRFTVLLRSNIAWHDGTPFTAKDVEFTVRAMKDPGTLSTESGRVDFIDSVQATGDHEVVFTFVQPEPAPQDKMFFKVLPAHAFRSTNVSRADAFRTRPVGTGPYTLVRYNDDSSVTFQSNGDYRDDVGVPEIVMREVSDKNYQAKLLVYESLEALVRVLPRDLAMLQNNRKVELYPYQTNSWWYVGFNLRRAPFDDVRVRQALAQLVDVQGLLDPIGTGDVLSGPFVKSSPFYNHDVKPWALNTAVAKGLLQDAGYTYDGSFWTKNGAPLTLTLTAHQTLESSQEVVINLQSQWRNAGVKVEVEFLDEAAWKARIWRQQDYDLVLSQWSFDRNEDVRDQLHSTGGRNFSGYQSEEVDALLDTARSARDPHEKKAALRAVHAQVHDDVPMMFLWTLDSYSALSTKVRSVVVHPFYFFTFVSDWRMQ